MAQSMTVQELSSEATLRPLARSATRVSGWGKVTVRVAEPRVLRQPVVRKEPQVLCTQPEPYPVVADPNSPEALQELAAEVRLAQQGDGSAMSNLIENNRTWVRGIAYTVLGDAHLAEDAAQEVCVRVVKHLKGLDTPEAFRPWVYRMTRNVALSMAQRRERTPQPMSLDTEQMQEGVNMARVDMPDAALEEDERVGTILDTIGRLPDIYREVLVLKHVQELSYTEMSSILGVSVKSLEVRLVRARKLLQDRLGRRFDRGRKRDPRDER